MIVDTLKQIYGKVAGYVYRGIDYSLWFSTAAGLTNGCIEYSGGNEFKSAFGNGFINNMEFGLWLSMTYPLVIDRLKRTNHPRLYSNIFHASMIATLGLWHYYQGTENPVLSMIPSAVVGAVKVNREPDLETKILDNTA